MSYEAMRKKMEKGVTGTGKETLTNEKNKTLPPVKDESALGQSFKGGPNDPCAVPYGHGKSVDSGKMGY